MIVLTSRYEALFRTFQKLVSDSVKVYILDRNGIIISHTNPNRVGNWAFDMKTFQEEYGRNTYKIIQRSKQKILIANYHDVSSGWTFVEEQNMDELLWDGLKNRAKLSDDCIARLYCCSKHCVLARQTHYAGAV